MRVDAHHRSQDEQMHATGCHTLSMTAIKTRIRASILTQITQRVHTLNRRSQDEEKNAFQRVISETADLHLRLTHEQNRLADVIAKHERKIAELQTKAREDAIAARQEICDLQDKVHMCIVKLYTH
jgi:hypothetical protein